jgi:predicted ferric reductase
MHDSPPQHTGLILIWTVLCTTVGLFILSKPDLAFTAPDSLLLTFSQLFALTGIALLSFSFLLSSRLSFLENLFGGLDNIYRLHHLLGVSAFILLINHPLLMAIDALPNSKIALIYFLPSLDLSYLLGITALYTMIILISATLFIRLPYHLWKATHEYMGLVILLGFFHSLLIASDVSRYLPLKIWILIISSLGLLAYIYRRFLYEKFGPVSNHIVSSVRNLGQITEILLSPREKSLVYRPGQFAFLSFPEKKGFRETHPFSFSSPSEAKEIRFSIKNLGDYTSKIHSLTPGTFVRLMGPYGQFFDKFAGSEVTVCIAGGIGITPFLSLFGSKSEITGKKVYLFYSVKTPADAYYSHELSDLSRVNHFFYKLHDTKSLGRLTAADIIKTAQIDPKVATYFICGPLPMMTAIREQLLDLGVRPSHIVFEDFSLK